ncbi:MAG: hypothetical protein HY704_01085, partial [Gemmatimonadetes bacterium]|nr:hypothetical protein [Gemmatimonadota bacterium]
MTASLQAVTGPSVSSVADASSGGMFQPFLAGWIVLLPLLGFLANGALALLAARRAVGGGRREDEEDVAAGMHARGGSPA